MSISFARGATSLLSALLLTAAAPPAFADSSIKDARIGSYVRFGQDKINLRLDSVQRVMHVDGRPIASGQDPHNAELGYVIFNFTAQNAGPASQVRPIGITSVFDDESEQDGHTDGPFVGAGRSGFTASLEHLQTAHVHMVQMNIPVDRKITKIVLDPNDGAPKLRYTIADDALPRLEEVPLPSPAP